jgi:uncharacterized membrane protein (DUF373 family)
VTEKCNRLNQNTPTASESCNNQFECNVADILKRFTRLLHVFFSLALVITVIMSLMVFFHDVSTAYIAGNLTTATIHALGSLLILWTLSELLHSEIRHLRGEKIKVTIFVEVAIAALVRKLLIISTEGATLMDSALYLASLLTLGLVYWLLQPKSNA